MRTLRSSVIVLSVLVACSLLVSFVGPASVSADDLKANPFVFVGKAGDCGTGYPAGSNIVTAAWLRGMGLPDNGGMNSSSVTPNNNPNKQDPHRGLLLNKNGPTPDCSSSGAEIKGVKGMIVTATFEVGYDYRDGGHCGAGAPRFNIDTNAGSFFVGCAASTQTPAPQDPQWARSRSLLTNATGQVFPATGIPVGSTIKSISIVFDEGTDTPSVSDPNGVGLAVLDNIFIGDPNNGGQYIRSGSGIAQPGGNGNDDDD